MLETIGFQDGKHAVVTNRENGFISNGYLTLKCFRSRVEIRNELLRKHDTKLKY